MNNKDSNGLNQEQASTLGGKPLLGACSPKGRSPLGSTYKSPSKNLQKLSLSQKNAYFLQDNLRKVIHDHHDLKSDHRLCSCGVVTTAQFAREVGEKGVIIENAIQLKRDSSGASFSGLMRCKNKFYCPVCAPIELIDKCSDLSNITENFLSNPGHSILMVTSTVRHNKKHTLKESFDAVTTSNGRIKSSSFRTKLINKFGFFSSVQAKECTYSDKNGWHPHLHEIWYFKKDLTISEIKELKELLHIQQNKVLAKMGFDSSVERGIDISFTINQGNSVKKFNTSTADMSQFSDQDKINSSAIVADYVAKFDKELTFEFTKIQRQDNLSFFGLLHMYSDTRSKKYAKLIIEFLNVFHGKARLFIPPQMKEYLSVEESDVVKESEQRPAIYTFTRKQWLQICFKKKRQEIIQIANNPAYSDEFICKYLDALLDQVEVKIPPAEYKFMLQVRHRDPTAWDWINAA
jgi:hypothetical protein